MAMEFPPDQSSLEAQALGVVDGRPTSPRVEVEEVEEVVVGPRIMVMEGVLVVAVVSLLILLDS